MESTLNTAQKKYVDMVLDEYIYTNEEIAEACGVDVRTVYRWKQHEGITKEINKRADASFGQYIPRANRTLIEVIEDGSESGKLKAIEMLYKMQGKYKEQSEVTITESKTVEERKASILSRLRG